MTFPSPHTVGVRAFLSGVTDAHGNPVESWADPVDLAVHAIAPGSLEPPSPNRDLSVISWTVLAPDGPGLPGPRDRVVVLGREYTVEGEVKDWTHGPWRFESAGVSFELKRVEG